MKTLPQKILLILIGRLGDFIVATSFIRSLRRNMPKAEITLITSRRAYHTALSDPNLDKVRLLSDAAFFWRNLKFAGFIFQKHDLLIDLNPSYSRASMALAAISGAVRKIAFAKKDPLGIYDLLIPHDPDNDYFWDKYARLAAETGITYEEGMRIYHDPGDEQKASDIIGALNIAGGMKPVAIHAGDFKKYDNRWPEEKFVELTGLLKTIPGIEPVYIIGPKEENATHNGILRHLPGTKYILPHSVPVLSCILKKTSALICNNSGTLHIAAASGTPTFSFDSQYNLKCWRPRGRHYGIESPDWNNCRNIPVRDAFEKFKHLWDSGAFSNCSDE